MFERVKSTVKAITAKAATRDPFEIQRLLFQDRDQPIIFDVGAYIGEITRTYRSVLPRAIIYSFEPSPDSFNQLRRLSHEPGIKTYQLAVSDEVGKTTFHVNADPSCNSFFPRPKNGRYYAPQAQMVDSLAVETTSIDHFCSTEGIRRIEILKLDVEGAELNVLRGADHTLSQEAIDLIYTEALFVSLYDGGCLFYELSGLLGGYGYTLLNLYNLKSAKNGQLRWGNAIFLSPRMRASFERTSLP
ncbi:MAG: FkbM family methyltransferase [Deltaproteobacteria bacterium]|nr:FkbM family methyltransferase [Deltaproteobacteria bacterium]